MRVGEHLQVPLGIRVSDPLTTVGLTGAVSLALVLRLWGLTDSPPGFFEDELAGAVSAWRIATTGSDVGATHLPFLTTRLELKQPLYFVLTLPTQALLGTTALAARLPAALLGGIGVVLMWWVARTLELGRVPSIIAAALFAVLPWAVHYGRVGWEPAGMLPFTLAGTALLYTGLARRRPRSIVAAALLLALGAYAYHPALAANAVLASAVVAVRWRDALTPTFVRVLGASALAALVMLVPYLAAWSSEPLFTARTKVLWVFEGGMDRAAVDRVFDAYMAHWDWRRLAVDTGANLRALPGHAPLYALMLPFLLLGLVMLVRDRRPAYQVLIAWLTLAPLSGALMQEPGTIGIEWSRSLAFLAALTLAIALGMVVAHRALRRWSRPVRTAAVSAYLAVAMLEVGGFFGTYLTEYPRRSALWWHEGSGRALVAAREMMPSGGLLCVDSRWYFSYTFPQQAALYLEPRTFTLLEVGWAPWDLRCARPGAHILTIPGLQFPMPVATLHTTYDIAGVPRFAMLVVTGAAP